MIPENVHIIPQVASWNSEGEQGFLDWKCSEGMRGMQFGIPMAWVGSVCGGEEVLL